MYSNLGDRHGDVEKLSPASLWNGTGEEELEAVLRKQRLLILRRKKRFYTSVTAKTANKSLQKTHKN